MDAQKRAEHAQANAQAELARVIARVARRIPGERGSRIAIRDGDPADPQPGEFYAFDDDRLRWWGSDGVVREVVATTPGDPVSAQPRVTAPAVRRFTRTHDATWSVSICPTHGAEHKSPLGYGDDGGSHGHRRILLGLDYATIRADLADSTIRGVWLRMRNDHGPRAGVTVHFGAHAHATEPSTYTSERELVFSDHWPKNGYGAGWREAPAWFAEALRDDVIRGLTINQRSSARRLVGAMAPSTFAIRISYSKAT